MALATRCPACHTAFRVVSDQLKLHQGLVRCGHCDHVFNGLRHLLGDETTRAPAAAATMPLAAAIDASSSASPAEPESLDTSLDTSSVGSHRRLQIPSLLQEIEEEDAPYFLVPPKAPAQHSVPAAMTHAAPPQNVERAPVFNVSEDIAATAVAATADGIQGHDSATSEALSLVPVATATEKEVATTQQDENFVAPAFAENTAEALDNAEGMTSDAVVENVIQDVAHDATDLTPTEAAPTTELGATDAVPSDAAALSDTEVGTQLEELNDVTFLKAAAARQKALRSPWRWWWRGFALVLTLLAVLQGAWLLRSQISLQFPALEPFFKEVCANLDCTWTPPQQIDALLIEQSSLQKSDGGPNSYALNVTLRNKADISIAMPAIELSLTDLQGQLLTRKVFLPQEYLGKATGNLLQQGMSPQTEVPLRLQLELNQAALNYRVLIFYP